MSFPILYPIIDTAVCRERGVDPVTLAQACLRGGARLLQLRDKPRAGTGAPQGQPGSPDNGAGLERRVPADGSGSYLPLATQIAALAREYDAVLVVNDRADIARLSGAAGVHVGQDDLPVSEVRQLLGPDAIVGLSTHTEAQVDEALATSASYVAVGPVFETATKDTGYAARGLALVRYASGRGKPIVAIGGVTLGNAPAVLAAGASAVALISDLFEGDDPETRVRAFGSSGVRDDSGFVMIRD